jgi:NAD(P)H-hydrate repair Nnr-like enzyme with NAD(P)H-hydrate epimerase domain
MRSIDNGKDGLVLARNPDTKTWMEFLRLLGKMETTRSENARKERLWANSPPKAAIG